MQLTTRFSQQLGRLSLFDSPVRETVGVVPTERGDPTSSRRGPTKATG